MPILHHFSAIIIIYFIINYLHFNSARSGAQGEPPHWHCPVLTVIHLLAIRFVAFVAKPPLHHPHLAKDVLRQCKSVCAILPSTPKINLRPIQY